MFKGKTLILTALTLLVGVCYVATGNNTDNAVTTAPAVTTESDGDNTERLPDFDGDGTIGFGDFVIFSGVFGSSRGDQGYDARLDLHGDGEVEFSDFVIFARDFGKDVPSPVVSIPDDNLRAAIETALGKASDMPITRAEMAALDSLKASDAGIGDLTGLEYAINLTWLDLSSNDVTNIKMLEGLAKLEGLNLADNEISDLTSLVSNKGLGSGDQVDVTGNPLNDASKNTHILALQARGVDVSFNFPPRVVSIPDDSLRTAIETVLEKASGTPITRVEMSTMDSLAANGKEIGDLTGLEYATNLTSLSLYDNKITDISRLATLKNLKELLLSHNKITDILKLAGLTNLTELYLWDNQIDDISALSGLIDLTRLSLGLNKIKDVSALSGLSNLKVLFLKGNDISDLAALAANRGLGNGDIVDVTDNPLSATSLSQHIPTLQARGVSVSFVPSPVVTFRDANLRMAIWRTLGKASRTPITTADMEILTHLNAGDSGISDLTGLESAVNLKLLDLESNNIRDLSPLAGLTNLTILNLGSCNIRDLTQLAALNNLMYLNLSSNNVTDLSPLAGLSNVSNLDLFYNNVSHLSPLAGMISLWDLDLSSNNVTDLSALARLVDLTWLRLSNNNIRDLSSLAGLTYLKSLSLGRNYIRVLSSLAGLTHLEGLWLSHNNIADLSPIAGLTNISTLILRGNNIADLSPLSGLADLEGLSLSSNPIEDLAPLEPLTALWSLSLDQTGISSLSALEGLANLGWLNLAENNIADVSPLAGLTKLTLLALGINDLTDVSALGGLVSLTELELEFNRISDISALAGLTELTRLDLRGNPLSDTSVNDHIPVLQNREAKVFFDSFGKGDYDIELVFLSRFSERQKNVIQYTARRWMAVIRGDVPDYEFAEGWSGSCGGESFKISPGEKIDDLRIYVGSYETGSTLWYGRPVHGFGGPVILRGRTRLPVVGCMAFDLKSVRLLDVGLHEIGHVLGFGTIWGELGFLRALDGDTHFDGPLATAAFNEAGGVNYHGAKVPVTHDGVHWRFPVLDGDIMAGNSGREIILSAITAQSLADLGYGIDVNQADAYTLPLARAGAKIAAVLPSTNVYGMNMSRANALYPRYGDHDAHGAMPDALRPVGEHDRWRQRLESAEAVWGGGVIGRPASPVHMEPELTCGAGLRQDPIYVVDTQGLVIRTVSD